MLYRTTYNTILSLTLSILMLTLLTVQYDNACCLQYSLLRRHSLGSSPKLHPPRTLLKPREHSLPFVCSRPDHGCGPWTQRSSMDTSLTFPRLSGYKKTPYRSRSCTAFNTREKLWTCSYADICLQGLFLSYPARLKCWKPAESMLRAWEMIAKP